MSTFTLAGLETFLGDMISSGVPGDTPVLIAADPEGNGFWDASDLCVYYDDENNFTHRYDGETVIVLWP